MGVEGYYGPNVNTTTYTPSGGGPPGGGSSTAGIGQAYQSSGQSMDKWIQEALGPTGNVHDVPGVETVDYTSDPVSTEQDTSEEIMNSNMSESEKWKWLYDLQSQWETEQDPLGTGNLGVSSPFALTYQNLGNPQGLAWQAAFPNEPGAQLVNGEWKKPILSGLGQHLFEREEGLPSLGGEGSPQSLRGISEDYYSTHAEQEQLADQGQTNYGYGYDYDPGSYTVAGGYGYGGGSDPNYIGKTPFDYGNPYSEARFAPLEQHKRMVDVNSPLYAARGGIMNLRR